MKIVDPHAQIQALWSYVDLEDGHQQNNICIRGMPESIRLVDLLPAVTSIFNTLIGNSVMDSIDIDRVHRVPGSLNPAAKLPWDLRCTLSNRGKPYLIKLGRSSL